MIQDSQVLIRTPHDWVDYCLPEGLDLYGHLILATKNLHLRQLVKTHPNPKKHCLSSAQGNCRLTSIKHLRLNWQKHSGWRRSFNTRSIRELWAGHIVLCSFPALPENHPRKTPTYSHAQLEKDSREEGEKKKGANDEMSLTENKYKNNHRQHRELTS